MKKIIPVVFIFLVALKTGSAQDPHFTQFFASPLTLNPAFTGLFSGDLRIAANYRNQWNEIALPYVTKTISADFDILKNVIPYNDRWGVGILGMQDRQAGGGLKTSYLGISTAYHKGLDFEGRQSLSLGFQAAYGRNSLDLFKLTFENQITNQGFDQTLPNGELFDNTAVSYPDLNVGLLYNASIGVYGNAYIGASYYHITQPDQSFLSGHDEKLANRWTVHGGGSFAPSPKTRIYLSGLFMQQAKVTELALGGALGYVINKDPMDANLLYVGSWVRAGDAINPYVGIELKGLHIGFSYDINTSGLTAASNRKGGAEVSLIYILKKSDARPINCPKF